MKKERLGFNLALMGMIASGKETQTDLLKKRYSLQSVETGVYTRKLLKEKTENGDWARRTAGKGGPLPVVLMKKFILDQISKKSKNKDLIFIGGPRLKPEAQLTKKILQEKGQDIFVIYITLSDKEVYKRSIKRKTGNMKAIYKVFDIKEIIGKRIKWHKEQVGKTVKYFESLEKLKKINGNQPIDKVYLDIEKALSHFKKLNNK
ncbi:MAG TPA: nucleoside monophosphate kinase [Candidatus Paceibacterota bacterium]